jgi:hypothetical protein
MLTWLVGKKDEKTYPSRARILLQNRCTAVAINKNKISALKNVMIPRTA